MMGDKITAKQTVKELGIPTVPGSDGEVSDKRCGASWPRRSAIRS